MIQTRPAADYKTNWVTLSGMNSDIVKTIHENLDRSADQVREMAPKFKGHTREETFRNIWNFLRTCVRYQKDPDGVQYIKLPGRLLADGHGDCKSFSLFTGAILKALGIPFSFRYASYSDDPTPTHVYTVARTEAGREVVVDGVYPRYGVEAPYRSKTDYPMKIAVVSGLPETVNRLRNIKKMNPVDRLRFLETKVKPGSLAAHVIHNEIARLSGTAPRRAYTREQLMKYAALISRRLAGHKGRGIIYQLLEKERLMAASGNFSGDLFVWTKDSSISGVQEEIGKLRLKKLLKKINPKKIFKAIKAVALLIPRKAFLSLVALNVRGLATRLANTPEKEVKARWESFGGNNHVLRGAINKGKSRKALFGKKHGIKGVSGFGSMEGIGYVPGVGAVYLEDMNSISGGIGAAPVAAILAAAGPILLGFLKLFKKTKTPEVGDGNTDAEAMEAGAGTVAESVKDFITQGVATAQSTGIIPDRPITQTEETAAAALPPGDDSGSETSPLLLLGGAGALYMLTK